MAASGGGSRTTYGKGANRAMKKIIITIAAIAVAAAMIFAFVGCGDKVKVVVDELSTGADNAVEAVSEAAESASEFVSEIVSGVAEAF